MAAKAPAKAVKQEKVTIEALGVKVEIDPNVLDDFDLLSDLKEMQDGNALVFPSIVKRMFGDDFKRVHDELMVDGKLTTTRAAEFFTAVLEEVGAKNS